ncbi:MAG: prepilin peptidase, partial [Lachnospiraceae bacterium]|nr:prepilin peptidase [Lachnospiraceae bacterium]
IGGGDIKLMAATGMLLGFGCNLVGFLSGCVYACIIHIARMKLSGEKSMLAMGPYLAAGTLTAMWFGEGIVDWYLNMFG